MYCVNCGVKLADTEKQCPLCGVVAYHPDIKQDYEEPLYPRQKMPAHPVSSQSAQIVATTVFLLPLLITLLCDFQITGTVTWSGYVAGALALGYVIFVMPNWFPSPNPVIFAAADFVAIGVYLMYINYAVNGDWFLTFGLPVTGAIGLIVTTVTVLLRYVRRGALYVIGGALMALGAFMPLMEFLLYVTFGLRFLGWSLYPLIALVLLGGMLIFLGVNHRAREKMEQKFFI